MARAVSRLAARSGSASTNARSSLTASKGSSWSALSEEYLTQVVT
jgi:hypothetical protein